MLAFTFDSTLLKSHRDLVDTNNLQMLFVFEIALILCVVPMFIFGFFDSSYGVLQTVYVCYCSATIAEIICDLTLLKKFPKYTNIAIIIDLLKIYSYCVFSGIIFNRNEPAIAVFVFMMLASALFLFPIYFTVLFHTTAIIIYGMIAIYYKPKYGVPDAFNGLLFLLLASVIAYVNYKIRLDYFKAVDDANAQRDSALIGQRLAMELKELESTSRAKSDFLARMSHDIRTPMNAIIGMTALARDEIQDPKAISGYLDKITTSSQFLLNLVNDCLDIEKMESKKMTLRSISYSLSDFCNSLKVMFSQLCAEKNITLNLVEYNSSFNIITDPLRFEQIFFNLLSNAIKYTPEGGVVNFKIANEKVNYGSVFSADYIIEDNGIGMSEAFQSKMFEPFEQESSVITTKSQGTGLGLAIVKNLVELMGGDIKIESESNKGTCVTVHLDLLIDRSAVKKSAHHLVVANDYSNLKNKHVLLFEDHPLNREIAVKLLNKKDVIVTCAENGQLGLEIFASMPPDTFDAILMDIRMPIMDGMEATKKIRSLSSNYAMKIPIIAMSANAYDSDIEESIQAGMNAHIAKPVEPKLLYDTLSSFIK